MTGSDVVKCLLIWPEVVFVLCCLMGQTANFSLGSFVELKVLDWCHTDEKPLDQAPANTFNFTHVSKDKGWRSLH